jgi:homeobox-leucine zipper protein
MMMPQSGSLDLGLSLGLTSQGSLSSSTTSGALSPWAAALSSVGESPPRPDRHLLRGRGEARGCVVLTSCALASF